MLLKELRSTLSLSVPLIIGNLSQIALGLIDSAMVGAISYMQLAAASLTTNLISIPFTLLLGIPIAMSILTGIERGRGNARAICRQLFNGLYVSIVFAVLVCFLCWWLSPFAYMLGQDEEVARLAIPYFKIMAISLIPNAIYRAFVAFSDGLSFTRTGMLLSVLSLPLNALLNYMFIFGEWGAPRWELYGAGFATMLSRVVMMVAMIVVVFRHHAYRTYIRHWQASIAVRYRMIAETLRIGIPSSLQMMLEGGAFAVSGIMIGWLGATTQAAHQIVLNCASTTFMAALGLSLGASIRVSHAYGLGDKYLQRQIGIGAIYAGIGWGLFSLLGFILLRHQLPLIFNSNPEVVSLAAGLFVVAALFQVSDSLQAIGAGLLRGTKDVNIPTVLIAIAYWVVGIPLGYWLAFKNDYAAYGIWWGFVAGLSMSAIFLNIRFLRKTKGA